MPRATSRFVRPDVAADPRSAFARALAEHDAQLRAKAAVRADRERRAVEAARAVSRASQIRALRRAGLTQERAEAAVDARR